MEKRTLIAIVLIMLIYWVASEYFWKPKTVANTQQPAAQETVAQKENTLNKENIQDVKIVNDSLLSQAVELNDAIFMENQHLALTFTNQGGNIKSIVVKDYTISDKKTPVQLIPENQQLSNLQLKTSNGLVSLNQYHLKHELTKTDSSQTLTFFMENAQGQRIISKQFVLKTDYTLDFNIVCDNYTAVDGYNIQFDSGINLTEDNPASVKDKKNTFKVISQVNNEYQQFTLHKIIKDISKLNSKNQKLNTLKHTGLIDWAAIRSKYFIYALIPEKKIESKEIDIFSVNESPAFIYNVEFSKKSSVFEDSYQLYLGPVDFYRLSSFKNGMEDIAELGGSWIRWISKLFLQFLKFVNKWVTNWGIVIIIFALILKLVLSPLTNKTMNSAKKMQEINPMMREIQQQFKNDPVRMNQELKKLYKEHKVNPVSGCLPLLLQMPIFFALYPVLRFSIDLRQTGFFGWLTDLSEPDPYWILPILMGVSMFLQQKMTQVTPSPEDFKKMDEKQQAAMQSQKMMMYIMPVFMFFIFKSLPSGLVLYWMVFNVFQIAQQLYQDYKKKALR
ncbi:MAG TPA: membrane protein insertase YidC [Candidatus Cloacimonadota bacterium]|nr:membrane protein insertase YidC [Candidatus Cloacimonadota bacterium]HPM01882.1 membrane protein insertase YidC [Candidatus Cloacimonadota bacterium]